ncbi:MAG: PaaI family thioesterase [Gemmobacter sp.]|nr:PaaI family thioesterase [Gemmobacter sp.]
MTDLDRIAQIAHDQPPFARLLGVEVVEATPDRVVARMMVTEAISNRNGMLHGGAIMGLADNLGGTATFLNLGADEGTVTLESKTNFIRGVNLGDTVTATIVPMHKGRTTMVWQTTVVRGDGKVAAIVTQTQMVLQKRG